MPRSRRKEVELFNFSFLDILACVIGLLIFILSIVVVSGGGGASQAAQKKRAATLTDAEHRLSQTTAMASGAAERRRQLEQLVDQRANSLLNPQLAAEVLRAQIKALDEEAATLGNEAATATARTTDAPSVLNEMGASAAETPAVSAVKQKTSDITTQTEQLRTQLTAAEAQARDNVQQVQYTVPYVHESHRQSTLWVELERDRLWFVESDHDFDSTPLDDKNTRFTRRGNAPGMLVTDVVSGRATWPFPMSTLTPADTVLDIALHDDSYAAFRNLRQWAWARGYATYWTPQSGTSIVLTKSARAVEQ